MVMENDLPGFPVAESAVLQALAESFGAAVNLDFIVNDHLQGRKAQAFLARLRRHGFDLTGFPFHDFFYEEPEGYGQWGAIGLCLAGLLLLASGGLLRGLLGLLAFLVALSLWTRAEKARKRIMALRTAGQIRPLTARALAAWLARNGAGGHGARHEGMRLHSLLF